MLASQQHQQAVTAAAAVAAAQAGTSGHNGHNAMAAAHMQQLLPGGGGRMLGMGMGPGHHAPMAASGVQDVLKLSEFVYKSTPGSQPA